MKPISFLLAFLSFWVFTLAYAGAEESVSIKDHFFFGEGIHLGQQGNIVYPSGPDTELKLSQIGITSTRDDLSWDIQKASSLQTIPLSMSKLAYSLNNIKARPLLVLQGNTKAIPEGQPETEASRAAYAAYAKTAAVVLKELNPIFEIWNEWNLGAWNNKKGRGTPENYVALVKQTYPEIKAVLPNGIVLAGAVGDDPHWEWTLKAVELGLMNHADGLSVHIYNHCMNKKNRTAKDLIVRLVNLHEELRRKLPQKDIPLYLTEYGWPTKDGICGGVSEEAAAINMAQFLLTAPSLPWLKGAWHYELLEQGTDPNNREHHFGHYRADGSLKPSGCVAKTIWEFISDYSFVERRKPLENIEMIVFGKEGKRRIAVWKANDASPDRYLKITEKVKSLSFCGKASAKQDFLNKLEPMPILIEGLQNIQEEIRIE